MTDIVAGRYRVERVIAQGGMGEVVAVIDQSTGKNLALKRLLDSSDARTVGMFEREYHTLIGLKHPRVIEVYDYGVYRGRPYYTMELLDGQDLRQLAPLPYRRACAYLRDIASSLALLHARKLIHRDVSPRNVRVTSDGRCKLIDFGALANFGTPGIIVGTAPYIAPESLQRSEVDHRADLFALGAVGYWLLTGTNAFSAPAITALPIAWRRVPRPPSEFIDSADREQWLEPIPPELDQLILSLLTLNPLGRPATTVEVIERLTTIADLEPEREELSSRSYLHGGASVGRQRERERLHQSLTEAISGNGATVTLEGVPGIGRTHVLNGLALEAQLAGATPIVVDAKLHRGVYGVAHALVEKILAMLPEESVEAAPEHAPILRRFSPLFASRLPRAHDPEVLPPGELRRRTQNALLEWLFAVSARRPLVIAVDNVQRADEGSAALLATLAHGAEAHAVLLVTAKDPGEPPVSAAALRALSEAGTTLLLRGLSRDDVHELVKSLFGPVHNTARLAEWLHNFCAGNPRACMDLVHHLVDTRVIRFKEGIWVLPQELRKSELPENLEQAMDIRLKRLDTMAVRLAEALCVHRGALPIEHCLKIAALEGVQQPHAALEALAREDILVQTGASYYFNQDTLRERLYARLPEGSKKQFHRHFGHLLSGQGQEVNAMLDAGWHLLKGDSELEGAKLLAAAGKLLAFTNDEFAPAVPALKAALKVMRAHGRARHEVIQLLAPLAVAGYRADHRLAAEFGDDAIDMLQILIGLTVARRLRPWLGRYVSLYLGLAWGFLRSIVVHGISGAREFKSYITLYFLCANSLTGVATICLNAERARKFSEALEPLTVLGKDHAACVAYEFTQVLVRLPEDRIAEVVAGAKRLAARFEDRTRPIRALPEESRLLLHGGVYFALGAMSCFRDDDSALHYADRLDQFGLKLYAMAADQVRMIHHMFRGNMALASQYRERIEMHALQAGTGWQVEIWAPCATMLAYTLTRDIIGIKAGAEILDRLSVEVPTVQRNAQLARCTLYLFKGKYQLSYDIRTGVLGATKPRGYIGWPAAMGGQVQTLVALGRPEEAKRVALELMDSMTEADEPYITMYLQMYVGLADAEVALMQHASAKRRIDALIEKHQANEGPLILGYLHMTGVRIALAMRDRAAAEAHLANVERWLKPTGNPVLVAQCEHLAREVQRFVHDTHEALVRTSLWPAISSEVDTVRSVLSQCGTERERADQALSMIVSKARGAGGYLFAYDRETQQLRVMAPLRADEPPPELVDAVRALARASSEDPDGPTHTVTALTEKPDPSGHRVGDIVYRTFLLFIPHRGIPRAAGAISVVEGALPLVDPPGPVLDVVARALFESVNDQVTARTMTRVGAANTSRVEDSERCS